MKTLSGALCCACYLVVFAAYSISGTLQGPNSPGKDHQNRTNCSEVTQQDWSQKVGLIQKASSLEVATMTGCPPCNHMKAETIPALRRAGYKVTITTRYTDTRHTSQFPTLYYLDSDGEVILIQVGFRTYEEVVRNLKK